MFATALIVFREVLEAALIIGIVLVASRGSPKRTAMAVMGLGVGLLGAVLIAWLAEAIAAAAAGMGQELLNAAILGIAVVLLGWHTVWMRQHAGEMMANMQSVSQRVSSGQLPVWMLGSVIALAVLREGAEVVLFLHGIAASGDTTNMLSGALAGLVAGVSIGVLLYFGMVRIPLRHLFKVTTVMIALLAAGLAAQSAGFLVQAGVLPGWGEPVWDTASLVDDQSLGGQILHAMTGYVARPAGMQVMFYLTTLCLLGASMLFVRRPSRPTPPVISVVIAIVAGCTASLTPHHAGAAPFKVYSPRVVKGETEVEYRGFVDHDNNSDINGNQKHLFSVAHAFTDYWSTEVYGAFENEPDSSFKHSAYEWENLFQLSEQGQYWADFGLLVELEVPAQGSTKELAIAPIVEKTFGPWVATGNVFLERQFGGDATSDIVLAYAARVKYLLDSKFEPGIEAFGEPGVIDDMGRFNHQEHWLGPAFNGAISTGAKTKFGYGGALLIGTTSAASDWRAVLRLEYEFY